jgi:hypothetical protein
MIGHVMRDCLRALDDAGWCETSTVAMRTGMRQDWRKGATRKALHSLVRRGLVERRLLSGNSVWSGYYEWRITEAGRLWVCENDRRRQP